MKSGAKVTVDRTRYEVFVGVKRKHMPIGSYKIMCALMDSNRVMSRDELVCVTWSESVGTDIDTRSVDTHIGRIRRIIGKDLIRTVQSVGYCWMGNP